MERPRTERRGGIDGIGCVGLLVLVMLVLSALGMFVRGPQETAASELAHTPTLAPVTTTEGAALLSLEQPSETAAPTTTLAPPIVATSTSSPTAIPSATATATASATATATASTTAGPSLTPSATSSPTVTPTATKPPPLPTPPGVYSWTVRAPILMYHYVSDPPPDADEYRVDLSVSPAQFRQQMQYLADNGFATVDLYDLSLAITGWRSLPEKPVILTFDDGYLDNYTIAFPILQEYGFSATFFIVTEFIDQGRDGYMTWPMIEAMAAAGMRIESHSRTHPDLTGQPRDVLLWEILGSSETLAAHIGYTPRYFCYPSGRYDEDTIAMLQEMDFWGAVTTAGGKWHGYTDRYEWSRLRVRYTTDLALFSDFVEPPQ